MFGHWLDGIRSDLKPLILLGASGLCWSLWLYRNAFIFENKHSSFLQVIALATYMGCLAKVFFPGGCCSAFSVLDAGGQGVFYPGTWWQSNFRIDSHKCALNFLVGCLHWAVCLRAEARGFQDVVSSWRNSFEINKASHFKKKEKRFLLAHPFYDANGWFRTQPTQMLWGRLLLTASNNTFLLAGHLSNG